MADAVTAIKPRSIDVKPIRLVRTYPGKTSVCNDVLPSINVPRASLRLPHVQHRTKQTAPPSQTSTTSHLRHRPGRSYRVCFKTMTSSSSLSDRLNEYYKNYPNCSHLIGKSDDPAPTSLEKNIENLQVNEEDKTETFRKEFLYIGGPEVVAQTKKKQEEPNKQNAVPPS